MSEFALEAINVELRRGGTTVVPSLNLRMPTGSLFGLIGPSGSGKTTIMRAMLGLGGIHSGEMTLLGQPAGSASLREQVGYMPQNGGTWLDLTARECLRFVAKIYRVDSSRIDELLKMMELEQAADRPLATLSGGQERRVGLAMAVLNRPRLLVLDEPTVGLDPRLRHKLWTEFRDWTVAGTTMVISTHVMSEAEECDLVAVVLDGRVIAVNSPQQLMNQQQSDSMEDAVLKLFEKEGQCVH